MEEAPPLTPMAKPSEKPKKEYNAQIDGKDYIISLQETGYDCFTLEIKNNLNEYFKKYNIQEISSIIKEFKLISDVSEICDTLSDIIKNQRYKIVENNDNLIFTVKICKLSGKEEEYDLILNPKPITKERLTENLIDLKNKVVNLENLISKQNKMISEQNKKIDDQNNIINEQNNKIIEQKNKIEEQNNKIIEQSNKIKNHESIFNTQAETLLKYEERITNLENFIKSVKIENKLNYFKNSNIIYNEFDIGFLIKRLELNGKIKNFDLLYSTTKDGSNPDDFHDKCDNINNTLTIVQTTKNIIFGGFTNAKWEKNAGKVKDAKAFCFSLNKKKIYNIINEKPAIYCSKSCGPCFLSEKSCFIYLRYNFINKEQHTCKKSESYYDGLSQDYELNNGEENFRVKELEVYKIQFK